MPGTSDPFRPRKSTRLQTRPRFKHIRQFELTSADIDRFSAALREFYPTIRFIPASYEEHWMEREYGDKEVPGYGPNYREIISERMRPPHGDPMPYAASLRDFPRGRIMVWVEPPGWSPQWSAKSYRQGRYVLLNEPRLHFIFMRSMYSVEGPEGSRSYSADPPSALADDEVCCLDSGCMSGPYFADDHEQQDFLRNAWRIARRVTTNKLAFVDWQTLEFRFFAPKSLSLRAGLDAADWTLRDRRHLIGYRLAYRAADAFLPIGGPPIEAPRER